MNVPHRFRIALPASGLALAALALFSTGRAFAEDPPKPMPMPMPGDPPAGTPSDKPAEPAPLAGRFFDTYDANRDGKVSKEEYSGDADNFDLYDTDHDGFITLAEMGVPADYKYGTAKREREEGMGGGGKGGGLRRLDEFRKRLAEMDTNKDGKVSKEEWKGTQPFDLMDRNKDGFVTMDDIVMGAGGKGGIPGGGMPTREERMARFKEQDKNGDGKVSREEFPGSDEMWKGLDKNGDGAITPEEIEASMKDAPPGLPGDKGKGGAFGRFDKNRDGKVSREEFPGSDEMFKSLDKDGDGFLEAKELEGLKPKQFDAKGAKGKKPGEGDKPREPAMPPPPGGEMPAGPMPGGEMPGASGAGAFGGLFAALDKNRDGKISRDEFPGSDEDWKRLDANGDGWITPDEAGR